ncbi:DUF2637 domain-containing protein [Amycolatopsis sp. TRM77291]
MSAPVHEDLVGQIRELFDRARAAGQPLPGRPTLAKLTGATDYRVRMAVAELTVGGKPAVDESTTVGNGQHQDVTSIAIGTGAVPAPGHRPPADHVPDAPETAVPEGVTRVAGNPVTDTGDSAADTNTSGASTTTSAVTPEEPVTTPPGAKVVSWAGFVFGSVMSVAANVLHTWLPAERMPPGWSPGIAAQIGSAVWPIGLLLSVEVLSRVRWPDGWAWRFARFGGTGTVALGSAVISYGHVHDLLLAWGYPTVAAYVGPLVLDGLMVISGFALLAMSAASAGDGLDGVGRGR